MKVTGVWVQKMFYSFLILSLVAVPEFAAAQQASPPAGQTSDQQQPAAGQPAATPPAENNTSSQPPQTQSNQLPNSPGSARSQTQPASTERPLGTAAAEIGNASGTAASKPAGVAIAPAKQHQSRSLLIKLGAVLGAGVAIGTVMALSNSSPSRPPNSQ
jgi:hypothetical protein